MLISLSELTRNAQKGHHALLGASRTHRRIRGIHSPGHTIDIPADPSRPSGERSFGDANRDYGDRSRWDMVDETHIQVPEPLSGETNLAESAERDKRLSEAIQARIVDTDERYEYKMLVALFEANLAISLEQWRVCNVRFYSGLSRLPSGQGFTKCWSGS